MSGEKPIIVSDFDDVIYPFIKNFLRWHNVIEGSTYTPEEVLDHDFWNIWGRDEDYWLGIIERFHAEGQSLEDGLLESAVDVMPKLASKFDIVVATARSEVYRQFPQALIKEHLKLDLPIICREEYGHLDFDKGKLAHSLGAVALVDDHIYHAESAMRVGVRGLLMSMPKNRGYHGTVERVEDWYDVYEKLMSQPFTGTSQPLGIGEPTATLA